MTRRQTTIKCGLGLVSLLVFVSSSAAAQRATAPQPVRPAPLEGHVSRPMSREPGVGETELVDAPPSPAASPAGAPVPGSRDSGARVAIGPGVGFRVASGDGRYSMNVGGLFSLRTGVHADVGAGPRPSAAVHLARLQVSGHVHWPQLRYLAQVELAGEPHLLDAEVSVAPFPALTVRVGQFRVPLSRQFMTGIGALALPSRSFVSDRFRAGRDTGVVLQGSSRAGHLEYYTGLFNGNGINRGGNDNRHLLSMVRIVVAPFGAFAYDETQALEPGPGRIAIGVDASHVRRAQTHERFDPLTGETETLRDPDLHHSVVGVDLALRAGPVFATSEFFWSLDRVANAAASTTFGGFAQAGAVLWPQRLELVARMSVAAPDSLHAFGRGSRCAEGGLNGYVSANAIKLQLGYSHCSRSSTTPLPFAPSQLGHSLILQLQAAA